MEIIVITKIHSKMYIICLNFDHCGKLVTVSEPGPIVTSCPLCGHLRLQFNKKHELIKTINSTPSQNDSTRAQLLKVLDEITNREKKK